MLSTITVLGLILSARTVEIKSRVVSLSVFIFGVLLLVIVAIGCGTTDSASDALSSRAEVSGKKCPWQSAKDVVIQPIDYGAADPKRLMSKEEVQEDIACLLDLFEMQYSAGDYYEKLGRKFSIKDRAREIADRLGPISNYDLLNELFDTVHKDAYDGHLAYWLAGDKSTNLDALHRSSESLSPHLLLGSVTNLSNAGFTFSYKDTTGNARTIDLLSCEKMTVRKLTSNGTDHRDALIGSFPLTKTFNRQITCKPKDSSIADFVHSAVPLATAPLASNSGKRVTWEQKPGEILYVRIWEVGQMDQGGRWSTEQEDLLNVLQTVPANQKIIIDYRSTATGDSTYATLLGETMFVKNSVLGGPVGTQKISLYTRAGQVSKINHLVFDPNAFGPSTQSQQDHLRTRAVVQKLLDDLVSDGFTMQTSKIKDIERFAGRSPIGRETALNQPIIVLTDGYCGSTCGMALAALRNHPKVKFFGTNSAGNLHFMSPGDFMLPRSRIKLTLSPTSFSYTPEFDDAVGFVPDIYVVGADPMEAAIKYLNSI